MVTQEKKIGHEGERFVGKYLEAQGFTIQAYNYRRKYGEIDVIARDGKLIVFVEVKVRQALYGSIADLIGVGKQRKIIRAAYAYITSYLSDYSVLYRFDVALLKLNKHHGYDLTYIPNAFTEPESSVGFL